MKTSKGVVFGYGTVGVALIAGGSSFAYADKGRNRLNPNDIAAIHSIIPKIGNPGLGNRQSGATVAMPAAIAIGRPITSNAPMIMLPAAASSVAIGRKNSDSPGLTAGAAKLGSNHGKVGKDNAGMGDRNSVSITSRATDKTSDKEQETAKGASPQSENAAVSNGLKEDARRARLPTCV